MKKAGRGESPHTPHPAIPYNAEETIKCRQCGNMITMGSASTEEMISCPVCGAAVSAADLLDTETPNEGY